MRYASAGAFRAALERRLLTSSRQTGMPLGRLRKLVVFDRLLARLLVVAPDRWILKGALALDYRYGDRFRTTKDIDLARQDSEAAATADLLAVQSVVLEDYFRFAIEKTGGLDVSMEGAAVRYHVAAELAGRRFEDVIVDIGFGDVEPARPELLRGPELLVFAEIEPVLVPALPVALHVAEKVHAYTRVNGGRWPSSRVKDLIDLALIQSQSSLEARELRGALRSTFENRRTHRLPTALPAPPSGWSVAYRRLAREVGLDDQVGVGYRQVAACLDPILAGEVLDEADWDPARGRWALRGTNTDEG